MGYNECLSFVSPCFYPSNNMSTTPLLVVTDLVRHFGAVHAVDGMSFELQRGQSVGLIGANGAGKTTALRMLSTLDLPDSGSIVFDGVDMLAKPEKVRARLGWMPDAVDTWPSTTIRDYLDFFARAYGLKGSARVAEVDRLLEFCGIADLQDRMIAKLSKGQGQRLSLARCLVGNPDLLLLDEPAAGLDPLARVEFKSFVRTLQAEGKTLLISSHILSELAEMCDAMIMMDAGKIIRQGNREDLLADCGAQEGTCMRMRPLGKAEELVAFLAAREGWAGAKLLGPLLVEAYFTPEGEEARAREMAAVMAAQPLLESSQHRMPREQGFVNVLHQKG